MNYDNQVCVDACTSCFAICSYCADQCLEKDGMEKCVRHCLDCLEICQTMASLAARGSQNLGAVAAACAEICDACADECEKHGSDHCKACAEACRKCAEECRKLADAHARKAA